MTLREIVQIGHPALRDAARRLDPAELATPEVQGLIDDLVDTMRAANGAGLAATQVGVPVQVCIAEVRPGNPRYPYKPVIPLTVLVNPVLEVLSPETFANYEGCLSVPALRGVVDRAVEERVQALDHLHGTLFIDRVADTRTLCTWDEFRLRHEAAFSDRARALVARFGG